MTRYHKLICLIFAFFLGLMLFGCTEKESNTTDASPSLPVLEETNGSENTISDGTDPEILETGTITKDTEFTSPETTNESVAESVAESVPSQSVEEAADSGEDIVTEQTVKSDDHDEEDPDVVDTYAVEIGEGIGFGGN